MKEQKGRLDGKNKRIAVVVSRFNEFVARELLAGALGDLSRLSVSDDSIEVFWTPGAYEIPLIIKKITERKSFDGIIALGVVLRGETSHFEYIARSVSNGISRLSLDTGLPVS